MIKLLIQNPLIPSHTENTYTKVTCETCDHWGSEGMVAYRRYCDRLTGRETSELFYIDGSLRSIEGIITSKDFGCALYENKKEAKS